MLIDNHGYYELSRNGHQIVETPHIDKFSRESVYFTDFNAPPFCSPSRAALLTGRYALRAGIHNTVGGVSILHASETTLAQRLKKEGYRTGIFGKWHLGFNYPYAPQHRGFDEVFVHGGGGVSQLEDYYGNNHMDATYRHNGKYVKSKGFSTDVLFNQAYNFIEKQNDKPFFAFISTPAVHFPTLKHPETTKRLLERGVEESIYLPLYSMIENVDDNVGKMLNYLKEKGLEKETVIILASDQGVNDRGAPQHRAGEKTNRGVAYDEKHQVYAMIKYDPITKGKEIETDILAGMIDITPTILNILNIEIPEEMDGISLKRVLEGAEYHNERTLIVQCPRKRERNKWDNVSVKHKNWRFVNGNELYDIEIDRGQLNNVYEENPEVVKMLSDRYEIFWNSLPDESSLLSPHYIGAVDSEVRMNSMDWYKGDHPWTQQSLAKTTANGTWRVKVVSSGTYAFELRRYPREADLAAGAKKVKLMIGKVGGQSEMDTVETFSDIQLKLKAGTYDMSAEFQRDSLIWGADFVYIQKVE